MKTNKTIKKHLHIYEAIRKIEVDIDLPENKAEREATEIELLQWLKQDKENYKKISEEWNCKSEEVELDCKFHLYEWDAE